jgi:hypothetical protein
VTLLHVDPLDREHVERLGDLSLGEEQRIEARRLLRLRQRATTKTFTPERRGSKPCTSTLPVR